MGTELARKQMQPALGGSEAHQRRAPQVRGSRRVLLVEDNPDGRESLRQLLELVGCTVEVAVDGSDGVRRGLDFVPDVGLIDIGLPGLDGYEVARRLRGAFGARIVLVACTAYTTAEDRRKAFHAGFDAHLAKPISFDLLVDLLGCD